MLFWWVAASLWAQSPCDRAYEDASNSYNSGRPEMVEVFLKDCIDLIPKSRKADAYKLLILAMLYEDRNQDADRYMAKLLEYEPEFIPKADDPAEFLELYKSFRTDPIVLLGFSIVSNNPVIRDYARYSVDNPQVSTHNYYGNFILFGGFMISVDLMLHRNWYFQMGFAGKSYTFERKSVVFEFSQVNAIENANFAEIPLTLRYSFAQYKRHRILALAGINYAFLANSSLIITRKDTVDESRRTLTSPALDMTPQRTSHNLGAHLGLGAQFKILRGYLGLHAGYQFNFLNHVNPDKRYSNKELVSRYFYVDDSFRLEHLFVSFGYFYSFYNARKLKTKTR